MSVLKTPWQRAYRSVWRREQQYLARYETRRVSPLDAKLEELAPESLLETLHAAFSKAFSTVFEKGTGLIDRAGRQTQRRAACRVRQYAADQWEDRASLQAFTKAAGAAGRGNVLLSGAAGVGMGLVGAALPDVPLFTAMVLKCVYETGESFGFSHDDPSERRFILCLIETALSDGAELKERNQALSAFIQAGCWNDQPPGPLPGRCRRQCCTGRSFRGSPWWASWAARRTRCCWAGSSGMPPSNTSGAF